MGYANINYKARRFKREKRWFIDALETRQDRSTISIFHTALNAADVLMQKEFQSEMALGSLVPSISIPLLKKAGWHSHTCIQDNEYMLRRFYLAISTNAFAQTGGRVGRAEDGGITFQNLSVKSKYGCCSRLSSAAKSDPTGSSLHLSLWHTWSCFCFYSGSLLTYSLLTSSGFISL